MIFLIISLRCIDAAPCFSAISTRGKVFHDCWRTKPCPRGEQLFQSGSPFELPNVNDIVTPP